MYTPQRGGWSGWSLSTPSKSGGAHKSLDGGVKGKGVALSDAAPVAAAAASPVVENGGNALVGSTEGLVQKISQLEKELFEYQYSMGLLLIEKKEWTLKYDDLREGLAEAKDALKREQTAHLMAISDVGKREENLRKALGVEKQCVTDLEKALRENRAENAEIKYTAESKLSEANALVTSIEEKSLELEAKSRAADAKLAEMSRKASEIERKSQDIEARESSIRRDRLFFVEEQKAHETALSKQREDLREWEKKLQEGEDRLSKRQIILNQREERANENDKVFKQKQKDLEDAQKKIEESNSILKSKEDDISSRIASLTLKEKEFDSSRLNLEEKEKELALLEEKLITKEKDLIQSLTEAHNATLEYEKQEFEKEIEARRKALDDELKNKTVDVERKEAEINHKEEKLVKREQALDKRLEKFREKEKDNEAKLKALKEREKSVKLDEKELENEKKEIFADKEELLRLTAEVERIRAGNEDQLRTIIEEKDQLKVSKEERSDFQRLQSELKHEIDTYMLQKQLVMKEAEDLRQQKEVFERDWEVLDEKRAEVEKELKRLSEEKEEFEKLKQIEEERLINEKLSVQESIKRDQEDLKLAQESFAASMEHEKSLLAEKAESERNLMLNDYEMQKRELEAEMQSRFEVMEKPLREREKLFEEERKRELEDISYSREVSRREMDELKFERNKIEKDKQEAIMNKEHLESQRIEMRKDVDKLVDLSSKLKDQREQFINERNRFLSFIEKLKGCDNCGERISEFILSDLQPLAEIENAEVLPLPKLAIYVKGGVSGDLDAGLVAGDLSMMVDSKSPVSGGTMSWLRKCTSKIFKNSPGKNAELTTVRILAEEPFSGAQNVEEPLKKAHGSEIEAEHSISAPSDSINVQIDQSDTSIREIEVGQDPSADETNKIEGSEIQEESQPANKSRRRGKGKVGRPRSVKRVVEEAKALLGDDLVLNDAGYQNGNVEDSENTNAVGMRTRKRGRAQSSQATASEQDVGDSEDRSDSVVGGQRKRQRDNAAPNEQPPPGGRRYNLRHPKSQAKTAPVKATRGKRNKERSTDVVGDTEPAYSSKAALSTSVGATSENGGSRHLLVRCTNAAGTGDNATINTAENTVLSEEVNGTPEREDEYESESRADEDEDENGEEDEELQPGEASIGKKLWNFLTT